MTVSCTVTGLVLALHTYRVLVNTLIHTASLIPLTEACVGGQLPSAFELEPPGTETQREPWFYKVAF